MIDNRRELLTYDITGFKSGVKLRNSHISLFKVALRSFERGDFDAAFELFNKLESDSFLPKEAKQKVIKNRKDIEKLLESGLSKLQSDKEESKTKKQTKTESEIESGSTSETKQTETETVNEKSEVTEKVDNSNFYPVIKAAMTTFADRLASSLSQVLNSNMNESKTKDKGLLEEEEKEEEIEFSEKTLEALNNINLDGSIDDILNKEYNMDISDKKGKQELSSEDIKRFLNVGSQLSEVVPDFMDSMNDMKKSLDDLSKEVPEIDKISENIRSTLDKLDKDRKSKTRDSLEESMYDDEDMMDTLNKKYRKQSDIYKEDDEEVYKDATEEAYSTVTDKLDKEDIERQQKELLNNLKEKYDMLDSRIKDVENREEELSKFNDKIKSYYEKEFDKYDSSSLEGNLDNLEKSLDEDTTELKKEAKDITDTEELDKSDIGSKLKELELNQNRLSDIMRGLDNIGEKSKKTEKTPEDKKSAEHSKDTYSEEDLESYLYDEDRKPAETTSLQSFNDDE
ncbi:MAG: hypothetical protein ACOCV8_04550, partial [Spirochaetota bacterium]